MGLVLNNRCDHTKREHTVTIITRQETLLGRHRQGTRNNAVGRDGCVGKPLLVVKFLGLTAPQKQHALTEGFSDQVGIKSPPRSRCCKGDSDQGLGQQTGGFQQLSMLSITQNSLLRLPSLYLRPCASGGHEGGHYT